MARPLTRITPAGPVQAFETFGIQAPASTHWRSATCAELCERADEMRRRAPLLAETEREGWLAEADGVDCKPHRSGWRTTVLRGSDDEVLVRKAAAGEVDGLRRHCIEIPQADGFLQFVFQPGQPCLALGRHKLRVDREEIFTRRLGDWRADLGGGRRYDRPDQWADDFHAHTEAVRHHWD